MPFFSKADAREYLVGNYETGCINDISLFIFSMTDNEITLAELFSKGFNVDLGQVKKKAVQFINIVKYICILN